MKVNGVAANKIINLYNVSKKSAENSSVNSSKDRIEISKLGKSLSSFSIEESFENSAEKIERLKNEISKGTYKPDSKLIASKLMDIMKERGV